MRYDNDMLLLELINAQLTGYGLEVVQTASVGDKNYWFIKVAGQEKTHAAPGRFMDWNEATLEITSGRRRNREELNDGSSIPETAQAV